MVVEALGIFESTHREDKSVNEFAQMAVRFICMHIDDSRKGTSSLVHVDLSYNNLQGPVPGFAFDNMTSLLHLYLDHNRIKEIPNIFRNLCSLKRLSLSSDSLTGQLVELFVNLSGCTKDTLEFLMLNRNKLSGSLPDFTVFPSLRELHLDGNMLNGPFPKRFGQLSNLTTLSLRNNQLGGSLPDFSLLSTLKELRIGKNRLNGTFSTSIGQLSKLELASSSYSTASDNVLHMFKASSVISSELVADVKVKNCLERERHALLTFKDGLIDEYGRLSSWGSEDDKEDCCKWKGIHCNNRTGHVMGLNLRGTSFVAMPLRVEVLFILTFLPTTFKVPFQIMLS
ncbi:hypothetical protein QYF36_016282 [Acer negundo]|nr:hypothetical protein QYF36_016282 [Acer negundo]